MHFLSAISVGFVLNKCIVSVLRLNLCVNVLMLNQPQFNSPFDVITGRGYDAKLSHEIMNDYVIMINPGEIPNSKVVQTYTFFNKIHVLIFSIDVSLCSIWSALN